jgi:hypothetical protein
VPFKDPQQSLEDILENIARIERFVDGIDRESFLKSEEKIFAVQYALLAISEAAHRLGEDAERLCPGHHGRRFAASATGCGTATTRSTPGSSGTRCSRIFARCSLRR